jgi:hypothetical protein
MKAITNFISKNQYKLLVAGVTIILLMQILTYAMLKAQGRI